MRFRIVVLAFWCALHVNGQGKFKFETFPARDNYLNQNPRLVRASSVGACGIGKDYTIEGYPANIIVFPEKLQVRVGQKDVPLKFDGSTICRGQTVTDPAGIEYGKNNGRLGYIEWETGVVQDLPEAYGNATYVHGYSVARTGTVKISLDLRCAGIEKNRPCKVTREIPLEIYVSAPAKETTSSGRGK